MGNTRCVFCGQLFKTKAELKDHLQQSTCRVRINQYQPAEIVGILQADKQFDASAALIFLEVLQDIAFIDYTFATQAFTTEASPDIVTAALVEPPVEAPVEAPAEIPEVEVVEEVVEEPPVALEVAETVTAEEDSIDTDTHSDDSSTESESSSGSDDSSSGSDSGSDGM